MEICLTGLISKKYSNTLKNDPTPNPADIKKFNDAQLVAYQIVQDHITCISDNKEQLLMITTGLGGSGKSFVIQALSNVLTQKCRVCAYLRIAAFNIKGYTLYSLFELTIKGKKRTIKLSIGKTAV